LGITHVLNAAKGEKFSQVNTNQQYYQDLNIKFMGINLMDVDNCKIDVHFNDATRFVDEALASKDGQSFRNFLCFLISLSYSKTF
jgi:dual specificity phosphatase 3